LVDRTEPEGRSLELLLEFLTRTQRRTFLDEGWFIVTGSDGRRYQVWDPRRSGMPYRNVWLVTSCNRKIRSLEVYLHYNDLTCDRMLAQLLAIQSDAGRFDRISC
jgi:hypothetical protein